MEQYCPSYFMEFLWIERKLARCEQMELGQRHLAASPSSSLDASLVVFHFLQCRLRRTPPPFVESNVVVGRSLFGLACCWSCVALRRGEAIPKRSR